MSSKAPISATVRKGLQKKVTDHNEKHGNDKRKRATLRMLIAVFKRGVGAYNTNPASVRPTVRSADQWAYARVNAFLYALRNLKFRSGKFDLDLLPSSHPLSSKKSFDEIEDIKGKYDDLDFTIPKGAKEEAERGLNWVKEFNRGGTNVGRSSARYIKNNMSATPEKVRKIAKYFPRHEVDKQAEGYSPGEDGYPSNGRIAWALWGGEAGKSWSQKLVKAMNSRDEKFDSAQELIERRNALREIEWEKRTTRFESKQARDDIWNGFNRLLGNWDFALAREYYQLLKKQVRSVNKIMAENPPTISGIEALTNSVIDQANEDWIKSLTDLYESMLLDFAYFQTDILLPDGKSNFVFTENEQEQIERNRRRKPRTEIIATGFYPKRKRGVSLPINQQSYNRSAKKFLDERLANVLPDMSRTMKKNLNTALRRSLDEAIEKGLTGRKLENYIRDGISKSLGKKNLGRAMNIARTEGSALANFGIQESAKETGLILEKEWITRRDGIVRDAHLIMDGIRIGQNETFNVRGYKMNYPADSSKGAPAGLVCNCRCAMVFHEMRL